MNQYKFFVNQIAVFFKSHGFTKKNACFIADTNAFYMIVQLQKDKYATAEQVQFRINVGITSKVVLAVKGFSFNNNLLHSQWSSDWGRLHPEKQVDWIEINKDTVIEQLLEDIQDTFTSSIFEKMKWYANPTHLIEYLANHFIHHEIWQFSTVMAEELLILVREYEPQTMNKMLPILTQSAMAHHSELGLNELLKEMNSR